MNQFYLTEDPTKVDASVPRYEQIKQQIVEYIDQNKLKAGDKLPTEAKWCRKFGRSRLTIGRALNELAAEGVVNRIQGSGTYVASRKSTLRPGRVMICDSRLSDKGEYSGPIFAGLQYAASKNNLDVTYFHEKNIPSVEDVKKSNVDGLLLQAPDHDDIQALLQLTKIDVPVVAMAFRSRFASIATVCGDNLGGMKKAVAHLASLGHRQIAFVTTDMASSDVQERITGFHQGCFDAQISVNPANLLFFGKSFENEMLGLWFDNLSVKPTAIICSHYLAFPLQQMLWQNKIRIPNDVSLIVTDESKLFQNCSPSLSVISQPLYEMGKRSLNKLLEMIAGEDDGKPEILPMNFIVRNSVAHLHTKSFFK